MKKIFLFFIIFFGIIGVSKADYLDSLSGSTYNVRLSLSTSFDSTFSYTGQYLYIKTIECSNGNLSYLTGSLFKLNLYQNGSIKNHLYITTPGTYTLQVNSFSPDNYRIVTSVLGTEYVSSIGCNINGIMFNTLPLNNMYKENTNTGSYVTLFYQDNYGNYKFNTEYSLWQNFIFYGIIILIVGIYLFFKFLRIILDLFFKR